jgi:carboxymethylenebutenolidase
MVSFQSNGGTSEGYLALPDGGSGPGVIVIQEWWGLVGHVTALADRFAAAGFAAFAPDLYHGAKTGEPDEAQRLMMGLAMDQAAKDMAGAAGYLSRRQECTGKVGTVGFCMGGSLSLWSAALSDEISTAVGFYPAIPWERMRPDWDRYQGKTAVVHCSEADGTSAAEAAKKGIEAAGGELVIYSYPGTEHAFMNDDRAEVYAPEAAALAWARTIEHLRTHLA